MNLGNSAKSVGPISEASEGLVAQPELRDWNIFGMTCPADAVQLEHHLQKIPGILSVVVNPVTERAAIAFDGGSVSDKDLRAAIEQFGYWVE